MLRNRTRPVDTTERLRKNRETELLILLEKCLRRICPYPEISKDDRILLRNLLKDDNRELTSILLPHRRHTDLAELQVDLRRFVAAYRARTNENYEFRKLTHRVTSLQGTNRERTNTRNSEPLQLRLTVDQSTGVIRKSQYERRYTASGMGRY